MDVGSSTSKMRKSPVSCVEKNQPVKKTKKEPFFTSGSNYLIFLNIPRMIDHFGPMRDSWEGSDESYTHNLKREIPKIRGTVQFLTTILRKLRRTAVFPKLNEGNPLGNDESRSRTQNLKIYKLSQCSGPTHKSKCSSDTTEILVQNNIVVGVVDSEGNMVLCSVRSDNREITTYQVPFQDNEGHWCYNLWYTPSSLGLSSEKYQDRK